MKKYIYHLKEKYGETAEIGYSGHEYGLITTFAAVAMGSTWIERHITMNRDLWVQIKNRVLSLLVYSNW